MLYMFFSTMALNEPSPKNKVVKPTNFKGKPCCNEEVLLSLKLAKITSANTNWPM